MNTAQRTAAKWIGWTSIAAFLFLAACGGGGGGGEGGSSTAPDVLPLARNAAIDSGGGFSSLAVDGTGARHVAYQGAGGLKYATCAADCINPARWSSVSVETTSAGQVSLALDGTAIHIAYRDATNGDLKYAVCTAACANTASWGTVIVDSAGNVGSHVSLKTDATGRLHASYYDSTNQDLKYATCNSGCTTPANWTVITVDAAGDVGAYSSLVVDGIGRLHVLYRALASQSVKYATCAANCTDPANWTAVATDTGGNVGWYISLAMDTIGRLHASYFDLINADLRYATCGSDCTTAGNWSALNVDTVGDLGRFTSLALATSGAVHVAYWDATNADLKYATCAGDCTTPANWSARTVDADGDIGGASSLALGPDGRPRATYRDATNDALKYAE